MLEAWAADAFIVATEIQELRSALPQNNEPLPAGQRAELVDLLRRIHRVTGEAEMRTVMDMSGALRMEAEYDSPLTCAAVYHHLEAINRALRADLCDRWFLYVPQERADWCISPLRDWGDAPDRFPSARDEIISGTECLAVGQPTAAVFHMMRVLERGLRALASDLGVPAAKQDVSTWGDMLKDIKDASEIKIGALPKGSVTRKEAAEYYGSLLQDFRHFKDAWRDRVMHSDRRYDSDEARSVLIHVRAFMSHLAVRLHE